MEVTAMESIKRLLKDDSGIAATEYVVLAALITGALVLAVTGVGTALSGFFGKMSTWITCRSFG